MAILVVWAVCPSDMGTPTCGRQYASSRPLPSTSYRKAQGMAVDHVFAVHCHTDWVCDLDAATSTSKALADENPVTQIHSSTAAGVQASIWATLRASNIKKRGMVDAT
eukprot:CAMPEP_0174313202 /NCGR_PEP_ID=MMETSP0810-20121108/4821_1 /TAXON_ID=73025 ORGANISM="Eutreptiella gymnastica-like, Strain CCMP1594" /NCGR_SAMPLE_ID=MMETSP0810 /ASSEMBLY_ACC=CAM_ASM_000659 /LENGTH=107 /DNA_ID=CAMNT_0015421893 /DNA_START=402 /DNA_END=722 /DNA_ORIENTATION=-